MGWQLVGICGSRLTRLRNGVLDSSQDFADPRLKSSELRSGKLNFHFLIIGSIVLFQKSNNKR